MRQGMASYQMLGGGFGRGIQLLLLAQRYTRTGQAEAGLGALDQALAWMDRTGMQVLEAEAHRMRGELRLRGEPAQGAASDPIQEAKAEACFRRAIVVARQQEARWWELRATISLCRLLKERGTLRRIQTARKPARCWQLSTIGLLRGLTRWICGEARGGAFHFRGAGHIGNREVVV